MAKTEHSAAGRETGPQVADDDTAGEPIPKGGPSSQRFEGEAVHHHPSEIRPGQTPVHEVTPPPTDPSTQR
jgi:hypothetical protein